MPRSSFPAVSLPLLSGHTLFKSGVSFALCPADGSLGADRASGLEGCPIAFRGWRNGERMREQRGVDGLWDGKGRKAGVRGRSQGPRETLQIVLRGS